MAAIRAGGSAISYRSTLGSCKEGTPVTQRALLLAMLGIVGIGSVPISAGAGSSPPNTVRHIPWESRGGRLGALRDSRNRTSTISGTRLGGETIMALNYPGACHDRALGVYSPHVVTM